MGRVKKNDHGHGTPKNKIQEKKNGDTPIKSEGKSFSCLPEDCCSFQ